MIAFIVVIEAVLALTGLIALCRLTRYRRSGVHVAMKSGTCESHRK
ncbi:hypothetical protein [Streptosporangium lutulentum]|uniref:Multisubunit Na+/H+ antiporter MnhG subunit n=1 Tax=Streptosporangium lutulentum TaxID=1461250 RepID=A0ABT9Q2A5_9ACTN|nr:hypothetical protein [Streptosporangium lutulentum]MDP9840832.1 multisubunit Na+/H+ antiporter MnhG subunit [Streptosporangium lutulentum]